MNFEWKSPSSLLSSYLLSVRYDNEGMEDSGWDEVFSLTRSLSHFLISGSIGSASAGSAVLSRN